MSASLPVVLLAVLLFVPQAPAAPASARDAATQASVLRVYAENTPGLTPPIAIQTVFLQHTPAAMRAKVQGTVGLDVTVDAEGRVRDVLVSKSLDTEHGLDEAAVDAAARWVFHPAKLNGQPVPARVTIMMNARIR